MKLTGKIKSYNIAKGYGFITTDSIPKDIFIHAKDVVPRLHQDGLIPGQTLTFKLTTQGDKYKAVNIEICDVDGNR